MPTRNILGAPELGHLAIRNKMLVPNGVHFRGVPLCSDPILTSYMYPGLGLDVPGLPIFNIVCCLHIYLCKYVV